MWCRAAISCIKRTVGPSGTGFRQFIPAGILFGTEVGTVKQLLQTQESGRAAGRPARSDPTCFRIMASRISASECIGSKYIARLNQATADDS